MATALPYYAKIKDRYCIAYFGFSTEYIIQLRLLRPNIEKTLPGLQMYIACNDNVFQLLQGEERVLTKSQLSNYDRSFAYIRELRCDMTSHPVEKLMKESDIPLSIKAINQDGSKECFIVKEGNLPTKSLTEAQVEEAKRYAAQQGYILSNNINLAGWVIGVESEALFQAAANGIKTTLIPTGLGTLLYKNMFFCGEVLKI